MAHISRYEQEEQEELDFNRAILHSLNEKNINTLTKEQEELDFNRAILRSLNELNEENINTLIKADILFKTLLSQISIINSSVDTDDVDTGDVDTGELTSHLILQQHYKRYIKKHTTKLKEKILEEDYIIKKKSLLDNDVKAILELLTRKVANMISKFNDLLETAGKDIDKKKSCNKTKYLQIIEAVAILDIMIDNNTNMKPLEDKVLTYLITYCPEMVSEMALLFETMRTEQDANAPRVVTEEQEIIRAQDDIPNLTVYELIDKLSNELFILYSNGNFPSETIKLKLTQMIKLLPVETFLTRLDTELEIAAEIAASYDVDVSKEILDILEDLLDDKLLESKIKDLNEQEIEMELRRVNNKADLKYISQPILDKYRNRLQEQQKQLQLEQQKQLQSKQQTRRKSAMTKLKRSLRRLVNKKKTELLLTNAHELFINNELEIQKEANELNKQKEANELNKQKLKLDKERDQILLELKYEKQDETLALLMSEYIELQKLQTLFETEEQIQELRSNIGKLTLEGAQERQRLLERLQNKEFGLNDDKQKIVREYDISLDEYIKSEKFKQSLDNEAAVEKLISEIPNLTREQARERQRLLGRLQEQVSGWSREKQEKFEEYSKILHKNIELKPVVLIPNLIPNSGFGSENFPIYNDVVEKEVKELRGNKELLRIKEYPSTSQRPKDLTEEDDAHGGKKSRKQGKQGKQRKSRKFRKSIKFRKSRKQRKSRKFRKHSKQRKSKTI